MAVLLTKTNTVSSYGGSSNAYQFKLEVIENYTDKVNNKSNVTINHYGRGLANWRFSQHSSPKSNINADGTLKKQTTVSAINYGGYQLIGTWTGDITHEDDGSKTLSVSVNFNPVTSSYSYLPANNTISGSVVLTKIPRATTCPNLSGDIESTYTIALNPAVSTFSHSLYVEFGTMTGFINASGNLQSTEYKFTNPNINFTIPSSFYSQFTGKNGNGTLTLKTYDDSTLIGSTPATLTANCLESRCKPSISGTLIDSNSTTTALTGNANKIVRGYSTAKLTLNIKASTSNSDTNSTVSTRNVEGTSFTGNVVSILKAQKKSYIVNVTNSRGFSTPETISATGDLIDYFKPNMNVDFARMDQTSSTVKLTYSGTFFNQNFGNVQNTITLKWYYKLATDNDWILGGTITPTLNGNEITEATITCGNNFTYNQNYRFKLEAVDKLDNGNVEQPVIAGIPNYSHGKDWFQHHTDFYFKSGNEVLDYEVVDEW